MNDMDSKTVTVDLNQVYMAWRRFLLIHSTAEHFGMFNDKSVAEFPYCALTLVGKPTSVTDLSNYEVTVDLTLQTDCYIDNSKISELYVMDDACWEFFNQLGFRRMGDSALSTVDNSNVKRLTSRFTMRNFAGKFLTDISNM